MEEPSDMYADVVIVGAGYAGLSALVTANKYLGTNEHVLIADIQPCFGGHWQETYRYIRLHQPYSLFTVFDRPWDLKTDPWYLATGSEVFEYLKSVGESEMKNHGTKTLFEHRYITHEVLNNHVNVVFESVHDDNTRVVVRTKKLIDAFPLSHPQLEPLKLSSSKVISITPNMIPDIIDELKKDKTNSEQKCRFVIVGSGKTAMDTIKFIDEHTAAPQSLVAGNGMAFLCRDTLFPKNNLTRLFGGHSLQELFMDAVEKWDGKNENELMKDLIASGKLISPVDDPKSCYWGILSHVEMANVNRILRDNIAKGRIVDVTDVDGVPTLVMEDGTNKAIPGLDEFETDTIYVVNCTTRMLQHKPPRPLLTGNDMVLSPQSAFLLPGQTASVMTELWFCGKLKEIEKDLYSVHFFSGGKQKEKFYFKCGLTVLYNQLVILDVLPQEFIRKDCTNPLKWFPLYRQVLTLLKMKSMRKMVAEKCDKLLGPEMKFYTLPYDKATGFAVQSDKLK